MGKEKSGVGDSEMRQSVLITGASRGIGATTARVFAAAGYCVGIHYGTSKSSAEALALELTAQGAEVHLFQAEMSDSMAVGAMIASAEQNMGGLDVLVCNAGIAQQVGLLSDMTDQQWRQIMSVNLDGTFYAIRSAVPHMVKRRRGAIVAVSSMWGVTGGSCEAAYSASKAGIIGLVRALAKELGPSRIRVNCVAPGVIATEMNGNLTEGDIQMLEEETPLGRIGTSREVADAIYYLASEASSFVTGQVLQVNGGIVIS